VTGPPGSGKSSLAYAVAEELELGPVLAWSINSRSTLAEGLYRYDAIARLRDASLQQSRAQTGPAGDAEADIGAYLTLGPLSTALLPRDRPRVLLIDEIDKSDIDLPNDLLHVFEEGRFEIPELVRIAGKQPSVRVLPSDGMTDADKVTILGGRVETRAFPFVVITSNGERELPPAFLRRCLRLEMPKPDLDRLKSIVQAHLGPVDGTPVAELLHHFIEQRDEGRLLAIDQLLNAVYLVTSEKPPTGEDWDTVRETLLRALDEA
jgi:MoxR-like ATPase